MLSTEIASVAEVLRAWAHSQHAPSPEGMTMLAHRLDLLEADAVKLERMLERRLTSGAVARLPAPGECLRGAMQPARSADVIPLRRSPAVVTLIDGGAA